MSRARALIGLTKKQDEASIAKTAVKRDLWSTIGRTAGTVGMGMLTGGLVNPVTIGLLTGGASLVGGAIGSILSKKKHGDIGEGTTFHEDQAEELETQLGAFGTKNVTSAIKSGTQAGIGQALKLAVKSEKAKGLTDLDFKGSAIGKALQKRKTAKLGKKFAEKGWIDPTLQAKAGDTPIVAMDRRKSPKYFKSPLIRKGDEISLQNINLLGDVKAPSIGIGERGRDATRTIEIQKQQQEQLDLMSKGKGPGLFRQTREGGRPILQDESLDAILQRQSAAAPVQHQALPKGPDVPLDFGDEGGRWGTHDPMEEFLDRGEILERDLEYYQTNPKYAGFDRIKEYRVNEITNQLKDYNAANTIETGFTEFDEPLWQQGEETIARIDKDMRVQDLLGSYKFYEKYPQLTGGNKSPLLGSSRFRGLRSVIEGR